MEREERIPGFKDYGESESIRNGCTSATSVEKKRRSPDSRETEGFRAQ
jgi:hypothetical protein